MARKPRIQVAGGFFHITMRGNNRETIYFTDDDRQMFLMTLATVRSRFRWRVHAFCLLSNHYHLLVETREANLAVGMQVLNSSYSHITNQTHGRVGHLFQRRYGSQLLADEDHLMEVIRYIPLNPVRAKLCHRAEDWAWSSYLAMLGVVPTPRFLTVDWTLRRFAGRGGARGLRSWVESGTAEQPHEQAQQPLDVLLPPGRLASRDLITEAIAVHGHSRRSVARHLRVDLATVLRKLSA
jgi:REP element-mobilizing transposase RayT